MTRLRLLFPFPFLLVALAAQPPGTFSRHELALDFAHSSREALAHGGTARGAAAISRFALSFSTRQPLGNSTLLSFGFTYLTHRLDADAALALPDSLNELSLNLGFRHQLSREWSLLASLRPGFFGDFEQLDADSLNAPLLLLANYSPRPGLTWSLGLNANPFSDHPVLPVAGLRWAFADQWSFNIAFPRSGLTWSPRENLTVDAGVAFTGGNYRITDNLGVPAPGLARLANTYVDFREVRAGLALAWKLPPATGITLDLGAVTDRKFDYFDRSYRLDGGTGFYAGASLSVGF